MKKITFTLLLTAAFGSAFAQNLLVNGSFEQETAANGNNYYLLAPGVAPDGWNFVPGTYYIPGYGLGSQASYADYGADPTWTVSLHPPGNPDNNFPVQENYDSLQQAVQTVAGDTYALTYELVYDSGYCCLNATWNGSVIPGTQVNYQDTFNSPTYFTVTVTGTGGMDVLGLNGYCSSAEDYGSALDNVSLVQNQAVPAPAGVIALGIGLLGLTLFRRRTTT